MNQSLVSLCMSSFNNARYAVATLESLRQQTYPNTEIIIIDDCSTDDSVRIIDEWLATCAIPYRFIKHEHNMGVCRVANDMISNAHGEYISIIASDDIMLPNKISSQVKILEASPAEVGIVYSDVAKINPEGKIIVSSVFDTGQIVPSVGNVWLPMLRTNFIPAMTALVRRQCFESMGTFDESLTYEDWDMWLRLARDFEFVYQSEVTCHYRIHQASFMHTRHLQLLESTATLLHKQLGVSIAGDAIIRPQLAEIAEKLYHLGSTKARHWLRIRCKLRHGPASFVLLLAATVGLPPCLLTKSQTLLNRLRRPAAAVTVAK